MDSFATRNGVKLRFHVQGNASDPPVLMIMGLALSSEGWDLLPERLAARFRVITYDNRGTGQSTDSQRPYTMGMFADDAAAVLDAAAVPRAHVLGISMGGMIAQEFALRHPQRVQRLALGCTIDSGVRSEKAGFAALVELVRVASGRIKDQRRAGNLLVSREFLATPEGLAAFVRWKENADRGRARSVWKQLWAVAGHSTRKRLSQVQAPTLVISGDGDRVVPVANSRRIAERIPNARLMILPGAGHVFPLEREAETVRALTEHFLAGGS